MAVTLKQIADHVGLSIPTVGGVLRGKRAHLFREETRQLVLNAARELCYRPNSSAQSMRSGRFGCVAMLLSARVNHSWLSPGLLRGIDDALAERGLHLSVAHLPDEQLTSEGVMPKILQQWMADGLLINYLSSIPQRMIDLIRQYNVPSIWINCRREADCVYADELDAGRRATERLLQLGHRRIAYVNYSRNSPTEKLHYSMSERIDGYLAALRTAGLPPRFIVAPEGESSVPRSQRVALSRQWLSEAPQRRPTGVIASGSTTAWPILHAATALGLDVPKDMSIISFHDHLLDDTGVAIDTVATPEYQLGQTATEMLMDKIADPARALEPRALPCTLAIGSSSDVCAPESTAADQRNQRYEGIKPVSQPAKQTATPK